MRSCKKYLLLLGLLLMAAVGGCGGIGYEETDENKPVTIKGPEGLPTNPKILIAYFSHTGNTELAAWQIQAAVGGQLFAIQTEVPYPQDKSECGKIAKQELAGNERPPLAADLADISQYDTIFIGYPVWYGTTPMAVRTFLEAHDFSGKVLVPFCTSKKRYRKEPGCYSRKLPAGVYNKRTGSAGYRDREDAATDQQLAGRCTRRNRYVW